MGYDETFPLYQASLKWLLYYKQLIWYTGIGICYGSF
jgi:hypothetical protein